LPPDGSREHDRTWLLSLASCIPRICGSCAAMSSGVDVHTGVRREGDAARGQQAATDLEVVTNPHPGPPRVGVRLDPRVKQLPHLVCKVRAVGEDEHLGRAAGFDAVPEILGEAVVRRLRDRIRLHVLAPVSTKTVK
jgi:hypothetical protein